MSSIIDVQEIIEEVFQVADIRLESLEHRAMLFMDKNLLDVAIQEVLDPLRNLAISRQHSQVFIDAIRIEKTGFLKFRIFIDYIPGRDGIALNILLEKGWSGPYQIVSDWPFGPKLHWTGGKYGPGDHFALMTTHPGFPGYHLLESMNNWGFVDRMIQKLISMTNKWLQETAFK